MKYVVIKTFTDLKDGNYRYVVGEEYPRHGLSVPKSRLDELATTKNRRGIPLIQPVLEKVVEKEEVVTEKKPIDEKAKAPKRGRKKNVE